MTATVVMTKKPHMVRRSGLLESNTSLMPFALSHKGPGEQPHAKLWTFPPAMFQKIPILSRGMRTSSRLLQGASRLKGRNLLLSVKSIRTWLRKRKVYRMLRVGGQGCQTTTAPPEEKEPDLFDSATNAAFGRLLTALEHPAEASPIMDAPLYTVLSRLSHAHPWTSLILDLKDLMPDLDRHYHHQLLVAMLQPNPPHITPFIVVDQFLYCLAITITNILTPPIPKWTPQKLTLFSSIPPSGTDTLSMAPTSPLPLSLMLPWLIPSRVTSSASGAPWGCRRPWHKPKGRAATRQSPHHPPAATSRRLCACQSP